MNTLLKEAQTLCLMNMSMCSWLDECPAESSDDYYETAQPGFEERIGRIADIANELNMPNVLKKLDEYAAGEWKGEESEWWRELAFEIDPSDASFA